MDDQLEALLADDLDGLHRPREEGVGLSDGSGAQRLPGRPSAGPPAACLFCRHDALRRVRWRTALRCGSSTTVPRLSLGAVAWGIGHRRDEQLLEPRLDGRLDLLDPAHSLLHLRARRRRQQRHHRAGSRGVADRAHGVERAVGDESEDHRVQRVDVGTEGAGESDVGHDRAAGVLDEQVDAGAQRRLGELDGAHVVLRHGKLRRRIAIEDVAERPAVGDDVVGPLGVVADDGAVGVDDAGEVHLGDEVDDAGPADTRDAGGGDGRGEPRLVAPRLDADHLDAGAQRLRIDAHRLDGTGGRPLPAADLCAFERRSGRARRRQQPRAVAEDDLGIGADVDDEPHVLAAVGLLGEHGGRRVGADVAGDARRDVVGGHREVELEIAGAAADGVARRQRERGTAERRRVDAEHEVMHDRVADDDDVEHPVARHAAPARAARRSARRAPRRTAAVSCWSPPGFIITYDTRLIRSSPKRICGFIRPALATISPPSKVHTCAASVVEPTSMATPYASSTNPGQAATTAPSLLATVAVPPAIAGCSDASDRSVERLDPLAVLVVAPPRRTRSAADKPEPRLAAGTST